MGGASSHGYQLHIGTKLWRPIEDWKPIRDEIVKTALELMLDSRRHPLLLIDPYVYGRLPQGSCSGWVFITLVSLSDV